MKRGLQFVRGAEAGERIRIGRKIAVFRRPGGIKTEADLELTPDEEQELLRHVVRSCGFEPESAYSHPKYGDLLTYIRGGIDAGAANVPGLERERKAWGEALKIICLGIREAETHGLYPKERYVTRRRITARTTPGGETTIERRDEHAVASPLPPNLVEAFNRFAKTAPVALRLTPYGELDHDPADDPRARAVLWLWWFYFKDRGWERVKRCARCQTVFVDMTKNGSMRFGSAACRNRFWNRGERRRAGHRSRRSPSRRKGKGVKQRGPESF